MTRVDELREQLAAAWAEDEAAKIVHAIKERTLVCPRRENRAALKEAEAALRMMRSMHRSILACSTTVAVDSIAAGAAVQEI
jgi:hypothetical protein